MLKLFNLSGEISIFEGKSARRMGRMKQLTILPVTLPSVHQFKKKSFTSRLNDKCLVKQLINLKCVAILPSDLSLITIHISD